MVSKGTLHFKNVPKERTKEPEQMKKNEIKRESYVN